MYKAFMKRRGFALPKSVYIMRGVVAMMLCVVLASMVYGAVRMYTDASAAASFASNLNRDVVLTQPAETASASTSSSKQSQPPRDAGNALASSDTITTVALPPISRCQKAGIISPGAVSLSQAGLTQVIENPAYYRVYGRTVDQIRAQLAACAPSGYFASTNYYMNWSYKTQNLGGGRCSLTDVRVGIHVIVQYPSWASDGHAASGVRAAWNRMATNLVTHEQGHVTRSVQTAQRLLTTLNTQPAMSCSQIKAHATGIINQHYQQLESVHDAYDHQTNHGQTQGAWL